MIFVQVILTFAKRVRTKTIVLILEALLSIFNFSRDQFVFSGEYKSINYPLVFPTGIDHDRHHKWPLISYKPESKIIIRSWSIQSPESLKIPKIYFTKILLKNTANRCKIILEGWLLRELWYNNAQFKYKRSLRGCKLALCCLEAGIFMDFAILRFRQNQVI